MARYYTWSRIKYGVEKDEGGNTLRPTFIEVGTELEVKAGKCEEYPVLNCKQLLEAGAIREYEYPRDIPKDWDGSPVAWLKKKAKLIEDAANSISPSGTSDLQMVGMDDDDDDKELNL